MEAINGNGDCVDAGFCEVVGDCLDSSCFCRPETVGEDFSFRDAFFFRLVVDGVDDFGAEHGLSAERHDRFWNMCSTDLLDNFN